MHAYAGVKRRTTLLHPLSWDDGCDEDSQVLGEASCLEWGNPATSLEEVIVVGNEQVHD